MPIQKTRPAHTITVLLLQCLLVAALTLTPGTAPAGQTTSSGPVLSALRQTAPRTDAGFVETTVKAETPPKGSETAFLASRSMASSLFRTDIALPGAILLVTVLGLFFLKYRRKLATALEDKNFFRLMAEGMHHWEFWTDSDGTLLFTSSACERISGFPVETFRTDRDIFQKIIHPEDWERFRQALYEANDNVQEFRVVKPDGEICRVEHQCRLKRDTHGNILGRRSVVHDITARKAEEERLLIAKYAIDSSSRPIGMATMDGIITYTNQALLVLFGYASEQEISGRPLTSLLENPEDGRKIVQALQTGRNWHGELPGKTRQGTRFELEIQAFVARDNSRSPLALTVYFSDITSQKAIEREIRQIAFCDALTGLPNRIALKNTLDGALDHASQTSNIVAVLMLDLDDFKQINDTIGHAKGDELLLQMTCRLRERLGANDTLARLGGDEFVLVLTDVQKPCDAAEKTEQILGSLSEKPFDLGEARYYTSASIGIALYPQAGTDAETLLKHADIAMYAAKHAGRNSYRFFSEEIHRRTIERHQLEAGLRRAIHNEEFFLVYQPQVDLTTGRIVAVEALLRWQHPEKGVLSPGMFMAVAEETGLIHAMGKWILHSACHQAMQWRMSGLPPMRIAVNLSAQQFRQPGLLECIETILKESKLESHLLELEITESVFMENLESAIEILVDLKARAIQIAIDDFGTGYSSLSYLKNFPIDRIKIAQDFVRDIPADRDDAAIVETIMAMANRLGLKVIAEGVETREQLDFLRERGCSEMQGYYFARPMQARIVKDFVEKFDIRLNVATDSATASKQC